MIKRLLLPLLFCVITNTVAQANTASEQVSFHHCLTTTTNHEENMGVPPKGLYKFNKEIFRSIYATLRIYLIQNVLCRRMEY
jgi:hypothetical protein